LGKKVHTLLYAKIAPWPPLSVLPKNGHAPPLIMAGSKLLDGEGLVVHRRDLL
jgi:hypothetical protein